MAEKPKSALASKGLDASHLLPLITIYAFFFVAWVGFANWIAPIFIAAAHDGRILWIFKRGEGQGSLPYLDRWSVIAGAVQLAAILHFAIVLFTRAIDRRHRAASMGLASANTRTNAVLVVFSATFLGLTVLSEARGDYLAYLDEWRDVLEGRDPWAWFSGCALEGTFVCGLNAYGPMFNFLAPLVWVNPLAAKLLFASAYLVFVIWLIKDLGAPQSIVALSWPVIIFWLINPFPWVEIAYYGHLDVLVALACVMAVRAQVRGKDILSGVCLATGVLLKFLPIVILPFLVFDQRRFRFRLFTCCTVLVISGFLVSVLVWGASTFSPLMLAATRESVGSLYDLLPRLTRRLVDYSLNVDWLEKPLLLTAGLGVFTWCLVRRIGPALSAALAVLITLLFYRVGYINYQMVLFFLLSYWAVSEWEQLAEHPAIVALLVAYFGLFAYVDIAILLGLEGYGGYTGITVLSKFIISCALVVSLIQFSAGGLFAARPESMSAKQ